MQSLNVLRRAAALVIPLALVVVTACRDDAVTRPGLNSPETLSIQRAIGTDTVSGAWVATNLDDYLPGDQVAISGGRWMPGETVQLRLTRDPDVAGVGVVVWDVVADSTGAFTSGFTVLTSDLGTTFTMTATGQTSHSSATAVFYDAPPTAINSMTVNDTVLGVVTVAPGAGLTVVVEATTLCSGGGSGCTGTPTPSTTDDWKSTRIDFKLGAATTLGTCRSLGVNINGATTARDTITTTAPTVEGSYEVTATIFSDASCANKNDDEKRANALVVQTGTTPPPGEHVTTTAIVSSVNPSVFGQVVTFTATVASPDTSKHEVEVGTVDFKAGTSCDAGTLLTGGGAKTLNASGQATFAYGALSVGMSTVWACYSGNTETGKKYAKSADSLTQQVNKADALVTLGASPDPSVFGQSVAISATVTAVAPGAGTPTGTVTFYRSGNCATPTDSLGADASAPWSIAVTSLPVGVHSLLACYGGDAGFNAGSDTESQTVNKAATSVSLTVAPTPSTFGESVTLTAALSVVSPGAGTPTGTMTFYDNATCTGTALGSDTGAPWTWATSTLSAGAHILCAAYSGNASFAESSDTTAHTVSTAKITSTASVVPDTRQYSDKVSVSTQLAMTTPGALAGDTLKGSVEFMIGTRSVGTATVNLTVLPATVGLPAAVAVSESAGGYAITAVFNSTNANFEAGARTDDSLTVTKEDARVTPDAANPSTVTTGNSVPVGFTLKFVVVEYDSAGAPNVALGDIGKAGLSVSLSAIGNSANNKTVACGTPAVLTNVATFSCVFTGVNPDAYEVFADVTGSYYTGSYSSALSVYDPSQGLPSGGGTFDLGGDRVNVAVQWGSTKGSKLPRGGFVAIRHFSDGSTCRVKANNMEPPSVTAATNTASFITSLANYSCRDAAGTLLQSAGSRTLSGRLYDGGTPGAGVDTIFLTLSLPTGMTNRFDMSTLATLTGGNLFVPKPSTK